MLDSPSGVLLGSLFCDLDLGRGIPVVVLWGLGWPPGCGVEHISTWNASLVGVPRPGEVNTLSITSLKILKLSLLFSRSSSGGTLGMVPPGDLNLDFSKDDWSTPIWSSSWLASAQLSMN